MPIIVRKYSVALSVIYIYAIGHRENGLMQVSLGVLKSFLLFSFFFLFSLKTRIFCGSISTRYAPERGAGFREENRHVLAGQ